MAGLSPTAVAARPSVRQRPPARFPGQNLVDASVSLGSRTFTTLIREGASAEELIEQAARENGGGVARVYYPQFDTYEIVAVKIGGELLVKGDPARVAEADFSQFADPESMKAAAVRASRRSDGGIHFSLGSAGIPIAVTEGLGIVFPNAEELRVGSSTRNISLWMTSVNADPLTLMDLRTSYKGKGGLSISEDALSRIAKAHGGVRSEKLMLEENLLVLDKDTGDIMTASQFSSSLPREIAPAPASDFAPLPPGPLPARAPCQSGENPRQPALMDAYPHRLTFIAARTFERSISELLTVRFNPLRTEKAPPAMAGQPQGARAPVLLSFGPEERRTAVSPVPLRARPSPRGRPDDPSLPAAVAAKSPPPQPAPFAMKPDEVLRSWLGQRKEKLSLGAPVSAEPVRFGKPAPAGDARPLQTGSRTPAPVECPAPSRPGRDKKRRKRRQLPARSLPARGRAAQARKEKRPERKKPRSLQIPEGLKKPAAHRTAKAARRKPRRKAQAPGVLSRQPKKPERALSGTIIQERKRVRPRGARGSVRPGSHGPHAAARPARLPKARKRKSGKGHILELLGLFQWKKRGRKFRMKKNRAP
jgi:hypothetical protein